MEKEPRFAAAKVASQRRIRGLWIQNFWFTTAKGPFAVEKCFTAVASLQ